MTRKRCKCKKERYGSEAEAKVEMLRQRVLKFSAVVRAYQCPHNPNVWHLTKRETWN